MDANSIDRGVSVCIPTFRRPVLLREAISSVFANSLRPIEVIVSDHDFTEASQEMILGIELPPGISLHHLPGPVPRTQSANVNALFGLATYERLILLHDDDLFVKGGIDALAAAWDRHCGDIDAVYGRQYITDSFGIIDVRKTQENDRRFFKVAPEGIQASNLWAALVGQFPNDCMMMRKSVAMRTRYPSEQDVGRIPVDFHFGVAYACNSTRPFVLIHDYVALYRYSTESVLRSARRSYDGHLGYERLERMPELQEVEKKAHDIALNRFAASAVMGYLSTGSPARAAKVLRKHLFRLDKGLHVRLALIVLVLLECAGLPLLRFFINVRSNSPAKVTSSHT
jgi:glycosyltransferase involved in cell wall biosynthesis